MYRQLLCDAVREGYFSYWLMPGPFLSSHFSSMSGVNFFIALRARVRCLVMKRVSLFSLPAVNGVFWDHGIWWSLKASLLLYVYVVPMSVGLRGQSAATSWQHGNLMPLSLTPSAMDNVSIVTHTSLGENVQSSCSPTPV
ncbi:hypothetical protein DAPPUDRAFT_241925 [Daphnia pulex]|uniref:Uncharacterized protein n=1 Tax=Daphnia pulex TaxID=6669 RepID=E9GFE5_DAPPU|nr:hypothetical protein DAPPUDRAFT_241925 [Daphnia pulex]|eukprot:EFX81827.1 hypothetical protein DAPPUDRAFT_241925 [Daphnia pulex]